MSAGQIDALYVETAGLYYLIDFKRVERKNVLDPTKRATQQGFKGAYGLPPIAHVPDTHYQHYSLQTSIYNLMLRDTHGIDVGDRMYLLRMHSDRAQFERVPCADLRAEAKLLLDAEAARLATTLQPTQEAAPPPAPHITSPAPAASSDGSPAQGGSGACKRPRGAAPQGKVWQDGAWVDHRVVKRTHTPATHEAVKVRPAHKAPRGMVWDGASGVWTAKAWNFGKRKAPPQAPADENAPPDAPRATQRRCRGP